MGTFNIVPLGSIVVSKHALGFLLLCSVSVCSVHRDLRLPPCLCERSSVLSVSFGVRKPAGTRTSVEALQTVTSKSDQVVNCRWSTGVGRLGPRHDTLPPVVAEMRELECRHRDNHVVQYSAIGFVQRYWMKCRTLKHHMGFPIVL